MSSGHVPPPMTSGEAIIFCINDEQQPVMREMDFVLRHSSADYGQQQCQQKRERKKINKRKKKKTLPTSSSKAATQNKLLLLY